MRAFRPTPRMRLVEWCIENVVNDQQRPYDHAAYPHHGAPGGPMDAFDDLRVRTISLQWATRLGKTFFAQCGLLFTADMNPGPMMCASAVEKLAKEVVARTYAMIHSRPRLNSRLAKSKREQRQDLIEFKSCLMYVAWSRSVSTLADKNVKVGHAGEYDKWEHASTSKEAHPHKLFDDRFKDYQSVRKVIYEGTPTIKGRSPIETRRFSGTNCQYKVPCPHCRRYQLIEMGHCGEWGIQWDTEEGRKTEPQAAYDTAWFMCRHCGGRCDDHHRPWMVRRGVWCPDGCEVDDAEALRITEESIAAGKPTHEWNGWRNARWIRGTPARNGLDASYQLSSLYALSLGWGDIAKEFVASKENPQALRNFVNQWLGETWQVRKSRHESWESLGESLNGGYRVGNLPDDCGLVTVGVDVQDTYFVFTVVGWAADDKAHLVTWGIAETWGELKRNILSRRWGGGGLTPLPIALGGIDSGHRTDEVYGYCRELGDAFRPTKGFDSLEKPIIASSLEESRSDQRRALAQRNRMFLWKFNKPYWQEELQRRLDNFKAEEPGSLTLPMEAATNEDFMRQILNNAPQQNEKGRVVWAKIHDAEPDDIRDALIIARVIKQMWTRGNDERIRLAASGRQKASPQKPRRDQEPQATRTPIPWINRPGGWIEGMK